MLWTPTPQRLDGRRRVCSLYVLVSGEAAAVIEFVPDDHLRIAIYDAMRGVKLSTLKRTLTEEERHELAQAMFSRYRRCGWRVLCYIDGRSASTTFMPSKNPD